MITLDTGTEDLRAEIDGGVAVITMNRPDRRNAFSQAMLSAMAAVLAQVEADDAVGCVVLTGAGGAFCAGGDVKSMAASPAGPGGAEEGLPGCALRLLRGCEWRAGRITPPAVQECGGALTGPGERSARVAERFADECLDLVPDIGEHLLGCGIRR